MAKTRLESFSDGVLAIIITIMVLELKVPHGGDLSNLRALWPAFLSHLLSFVYLGIYWNNHHHMLQTCRQVQGSILWANTHLLFWLSLVPFATRWLGENHFAAAPSALYGFVLLMSAIAYRILQALIIAAQGKHSLLGRAVRGDWKGRVSSVLYFIAVPVAFLWTWVSLAIYVVAALLWLVPDRRIERLVLDADT